MQSQSQGRAVSWIIRCGGQRWVRQRLAGACLELHIVVNRVTWGWGGMACKLFSFSLLSVIGLWILFSFLCELGGWGAVLFFSLGTTHHFLTQKTTKRKEWSPKYQSNTMKKMSPLLTYTALECSVVMLRRYVL